VSSSRVKRFLIQRLLTLDDEGDTFLHNVRNHSASDTVSYPRGPESSKTTL
jgi:hypothetical protein